jgi:hypothetical protein
MTKSIIIISPRTKVGELLDAYPELEPVLMAMSPAFEKLRNPILRKTVAKVATLQQVSVVGGVSINEMIRVLREAAGQNDTESSSDNEGVQSEETPAWYDTTRVTERFDASAIINSGESPMKEILHRTNLLKPGEIFELQTPFTPAPIIDMLRAKNFNIYTIVNNNVVLTFVCKQNS